VRPDKVTSFAVLYLPYSLIGPFAGVFIDRWSRRQIMLWTALLRSGFAGLTAIFLVTGARHLPIWLAALVVLGVNRFFLSSLSAALPHVVQDDELIMANSVGPTSGTVMAFIGGIISDVYGSAQRAECPSIADAADSSKRWG